MEYSISLVDYIGKIENGVAVILSLMIDDKPYEIIYWFNREKKYTFTIEPSFYEDYPIGDIEKNQYFPELLNYIDTEILPDTEEIFKTFGV